LPIAALLDQIHKDTVFKNDIVAHQIEALEKYSRENVSRILMSHVEKVAQL
jgi:hypothetical protein